MNIATTSRIYLVCGITDMRKSFNGLAGIVEGLCEKGTLSGDVYLFCNRNKTRVKVIYWDGSGLWVCAKRLERGRFSWMDTDKDKSVSISYEELAMLLGGIDPADTYQKKWFRTK